MKQVWVKRSTCSRTPLDDVRCGVAHPDHGDPRAEVDQRVAVDVDEHAAACALDEHRQDRADAGSDDGLAALHQRPRPRARDLGDEQAALGERGAAWGESGGHGTLLEVARCDEATLRPVHRARQRTSRQVGPAPVGRNGGFVRAGLTVDEVSRQS